MIKSRLHEANHRLRTPAARELSVNPKKSWSLNFRLNLKIANFRVRLYHVYGRFYGANRRRLAT